MKTWANVKSSNGKKIYNTWFDINSGYFSWDCECEYGSMWRGKRAKPCRHLFKILRALLGEEMKLTETQKETLKKMVNNTCQLCGKPETEDNKLEIHRIIRGEKGGKYAPNNCLVIHNKCHKTIHSKEF